MEEENLEDSDLIALMRKEIGLKSPEEIWYEGLHGLMRKELELQNIHPGININDSKP